MIAALNDPVAFKQAMTNLTNSPEGEAFRAEGRAGARGDAEPAVEPAADASSDTGAASADHGPLRSTNDEEDHKTRRSGSDADCRCNRLRHC